MCFSAGASFTAGGVLTSVGVASHRKVRSPDQRLFAAIPFLFGLQQLAEGALWVTLKSGEHIWLQNVATYIFLIMALVVWPLMVPLSMWFMEKVEKRKNILVGLIIAGCVVSIFYIFCLIFYDVTPRINNLHIQYVNDFPWKLVNVVCFFYIVSTIIPLFVSSVRGMWLLGVLILASCLVTLIFFSRYLTSVWCFFAAIASVVIYWILSVSNSKAPDTNDEGKPAMET